MSTIQTRLAGFPREELGHGLHRGLAPNTIVIALNRTDVPTVRTALRSYQGVPSGFVSYCEQLYLQRTPEIGREMSRLLAWFPHCLKTA